MKSNYAATIAASLILCASQTALGQADYPTLQGGQPRTGHNTDPKNYNSGLTLPQWYVGNNPADPFGTIIVDDDYPGTSATTPGITYSNTTPAQVIGTAGPTTGTWQVPSNVNSEASIFYQPAGAPNAYHYSTCVPTAQGGSVIAGQSGTANSWTWTAPLGNFGYKDSYALYAFIPFGFTGTGTATNLTPARYFVYNIKFGNGQSYIDVVDTFASGYGWIRLGGGGLNTNAVFNYDGIHPISVTLYNTITRDSSGNLTSGTTSTASNYVVYADAFKCVPNSGYYTATPTSAYLRSATGAPIVDTSGDIDVAPQASGAHQARITSVFNSFVSSFSGTTYQTVAQGVVKNYVMDPETWPQPPTPQGANGVPYAAWTWTALQSSLTGTVDSLGTPTTGWTAGTVNSYEGSGYYEAPIVSTPANEQTVTFTPQTLATNNYYTVYAYFPGNKAPESYGSAVTYNILVGGTIYSSGTVNEAAGGGWVQLGTTSFPNQVYANGVQLYGSLTVQLTNLSTSPGDTGKLAYASAVEFATPNTNYIINSSPVHAQVHIKKSDGTTPLTQVVIVADENGRLHCLDEVGNGDGTTTEYWSYPTTPNPGNSTFQDPNLTNNIDGPSTSTVPVAVMPTQFSLSTAVVVPASQSNDPAGYDRLYISSTNGRVYCIDMTGRGDYGTTTTQPGTTQRLWSYPNDYPQTQVASTLGAFRGSVVYADSSVSSNITKPTIFVPAPQGRLYSLDALGTVSTRSTTVNWAYPSLKSPTIAPIEMTPNLAFGYLFFGTMSNPNNGAPGTVYALNANGGNVEWFFNGITNGANVGTNTVAETVEDFLAGPASAPATMLTEPGAPYQVVSHDSVYFMNSNGSVYGFNGETGSLLTDSSGLGFVYDTAELNATCTQNLGINYITTYDRNGQTGSLPRSMPVVMIPDTTGQIFALFANVDEYNAFSYTAQNGVPAYLSLEAFDQPLFGQNITSLAFSNSRMITADDAGYMYVFDNDSANYGLENGGQPVPSAAVPPNSPEAGADAFRYIHMKAITSAGATDLGQVNNVNQPVNANDTYPNVCGNGVNGIGIYDFTQTPANPNPSTGFAFEWGETVNILVYDFPYYPPNATTTNGAQTATNSEMVNIRLSQNGKTFYTRSVPAHQFDNPTTAPTTDGRRVQGVNVPLPNGLHDDGYSVVSITFSGLGNNATPPGPGIVTADITTSLSQLSSNGTGTNSTAQTYQEIASDPSPLYARIPYVVNDPIGFEVLDAWTGTATVANPLRHDYAVTTNRYDAAANNNGTIVAGSSGALYPTQFMQSLGFGLDGQQVNMTMRLYDRSLMATTPVGGLRQVRVAPSDLQWQGAGSSIYNPLPANLYPGFEDPPVNFPNNSLDYPNISRDRLAFTTYQNDAVTNLLLTGSTLNPPTDSNGNPLTTNSNVSTRLLVPTPVTISLNVPQYQPAVNYSWLKSNAAANPFNPNNTTQGWTDSAGNVVPQGYVSLMDIFVDSIGDGTFVNTDAYRQLYLATNVTPDYQLNVGTPTVDLGSLANGTGYSPLDPVNQGASGNFNPWNGIWDGAYQPFSVQNNSNLNLLNLHMAKASKVNTPGGNEFPWLFTSSANDVNAVLDGSLDLWSNLDPLYAPVNPHSSQNNVFSQKARVTDGVGTQVVLNPTPRQNPNLGVSANANPLNGSYPANASPKVSVSIPFGFPSGTYSSDLKVIDDTTINGNDLSQVWEQIYGTSAPTYASTAVEPYTNNDLIVSFTSREVRLTNSNTPYTAAMDPFLFINEYLVKNNTTVPPPFTPSYSDPTAIRDSFGSIVAAWSSNENLYTTTAPVSPAPSDAGRRIGIYSVSNPTTFQSTGMQVPSNSNRNTVPGITPSQPLDDLDFFQSNNGIWFKQYSPGGGYPSANIIPNDNNGNVISGTSSYDSPSFPVTGSKDPTSGTDLGFEYMAFLGHCQKTTPTGRIGENHVFLTQVKSASGGAVSIDTAPGSPFTTSSLNGGPGDDPVIAKGKPTVAQTGTGAFVLYGATEGNSSGIHVSRYSVGQKGFVSTLSLNFGTGFESVSQPKATIRHYNGLNKTKYTPNLLDLTFSGRLKGQAHADVYLAQMRLLQLNDWQIVDASGNSIEQTNAGTPFAYFSQQLNELLSSDGNGTFRSRGVAWDRTQQISLYQYNQSNGNATDLLIESSRNSDRETGILSYDTILGGKVYIDPDLGTVKFTQAQPAQNVDIRMTYTPGFLRLSRSGSLEAYTDPTGIYEDNYTSDPTGWFTQGGNPLTSGNTMPQDGRFVFMYGRASGESQTARPYMSTMRLGVRLPYRIAVAANGLPINGSNGSTNNGLVVSGNQGPYQIDPANGRVYFTDADEDSTVTITFTGVVEGNNSPNTTQTTVSNANVTWINEEGETPVLIDNAVNEGNICTFLDPFTFTGGGRPSLFWMFYTSTRAGSPDVYMQTVAPRFAPVLK